MSKIEKEKEENRTVEEQIAELEEDLEDDIANEELEQLAWEVAYFTGMPYLEALEELKNGKTATELTMKGYEVVDEEDLTSHRPFDYETQYTRPVWERGLTYIPEVPPAGEVVMVEDVDDVWESGLDDETYDGSECPYCRFPDIHISYPVYLTIRTLMVRTKTEFLVYLRFHKELLEKDIEVLTNLYIPKQSVTWAAVKVSDDEEGKRADAVMHKHPKGIGSFSGTDEDHVNVNHDISILVVEGKEDIEDWVAVRRFKTECGLILTKEVKVKLWTPEVEVDMANITDETEVKKWKRKKKKKKEKKDKKD